MNTPPQVELRSGTNDYRHPERFLINQDDDDR
jgi:hypothetical protein